MQLDRGRRQRPDRAPLRLRISRSRDGTRLPWPRGIGRIESVRTKRGGKTESKTQYGVMSQRLPAHSDDCSHRFRSKPAICSERSQPGIPMIPAG
jgi:hypothetical protein